MDRGDTANMASAHRAKLPELLVPLAGRQGRATAETVWSPRDGEEGLAEIASNTINLLSQNGVFVEDENPLAEGELQQVDAAVRSAAERVARDAIRQDRWENLVFPATLTTSLAATSVGVAALWELPWWTAIVAAAVQIITGLASVVVPNRFQPWATWLAFASGVVAGGAVVAIQAPSPGWVVIMAIPLAGLTTLASHILMTIIGRLRTAGLRALGIADDPYAAVSFALLSVLGTAAGPLSEPEGQWGEDRRRRIVCQLELAACAMEQNVAGFGPRLRPTRIQLVGRGRRIAAWLRNLEADVIVPGSEAGLRVLPRLVTALRATAAGKWSAIEIQGDAPQPTRTLLRRFAPRAIAASALAAAAFIAPEALTLTGPEQRSLTIGLLFIAAGILAGGSAADAVKQAGGLRGPAP
jgi:hypothetical protein